MKTLEELRKLDIAKLREELKELRKNLFKIRFEVSVGQSKNIHKISLHKKQVARVETILREKEIIKELSSTT